MTRRRPALPHLHPPPHWQAVVAVLALIAVFGLVAGEYAIWAGALVVGVLALLLIATIVARRRQRARLTRQLALTFAGLATAILLGTIGLVIWWTVDDGGTNGPQPTELLLYAALMWLANVVLFAYWYWEIDAGGPAARHHGRYESADLVFPQLQRGQDGDGWVPNFIDYLFFAFNSSTAFSPTDTLVLSRRMKVIMMCQSVISLVVLAVLAARAVGALGTNTPS